MTDNELWAAWDILRGAELTGLEELQVKRLKQHIDTLSGERSFARVRNLAINDLVEACKGAMRAMTNERYLKPRIGMESEYEACRAALEKLEAVPA